MHPYRLTLDEELECLSYPKLPAHIVQAAIRTDDGVEKIITDLNEQNPTLAKVSVVRAALGLGLGDYLKDGGSEEYTQVIKLLRGAPEGFGNDIFKALYLEARSLGYRLAYNLNRDEDGRLLGRETVAACCGRRAMAVAFIYSALKHSDYQALEIVLSIDGAPAIFEELEKISIADAAVAAGANREMALDLMNVTAVSTEQAMDLMEKHLNSSLNAVYDPAYCHDALAKHPQLLGEMASELATCGAAQLHKYVGALQHLAAQDADLYLVHARLKYGRYGWVDYAHREPNRAVDRSAILDHVIERGENGETHVSAAFLVLFTNDELEQHPNADRLFQLKHMHFGDKDALRRVSSAKYKTLAAASRLSL